MLTEAEVKKLQSLSDEMAQLIEDPDNTSNEASVTYGQIGRACARVLSRHAAAEAKRALRTGHVDKFKGSRQKRSEKIRSKKQGPTPAPAQSGQNVGGNQRNRGA